MEQGKTRADVARIAGVSRARITQVMSLLKLHPEIQDYLNNAEHNLNTKLLTERGLRKIVRIQDKDEQLRIFKQLIV